MVKGKIYSTGNETLEGKFNISYYVLEKDAKFLAWLSKLLVEVFEAENAENKAKFVQVKNESETEREVRIKDINKMVDIKETYSNTVGDRVDLFYGVNRVYVTLRKSFDTKNKFASFMTKSREWIKIEEVKKDLINTNYAKRKK